MSKKLKKKSGKTPKFSCGSGKSSWPSSLLTVGLRKHSWNREELAVHWHNCICRLYPGYATFIKKCVSALPVKDLPLYLVDNPPFIIEIIEQIFKKGVKKHENE